MSPPRDAPAVVVGASVAGVRVVQGLRARGYDRPAWTDPVTGRTRRTEHWTTAREQASYVADALVDGGSRGPFSTTRYVRSDQHSSGSSTSATPERAPGHASNRPATGAVGSSCTTATRW